MRDFFLSWAKFRKGLIEFVNEDRVEDVFLSLVGGGEVNLRVKPEHRQPLKEYAERNGLVAITGETEGTLCIQLPGAV